MVRLQRTVSSVPVRSAGRSRWIGAWSIAIALGLTLAACTGGGNRPSPNSSQPRVSGAPQEGGTATFAEAPGTPPNYIFPLIALQYFNTSNVNQFQYLMWRPLYWFGDGDQIVLNKALSLAEPPVYSSNNTIVDIKLKPYKWSDGKPVTSRDVTFWINMVRAEKDIYANYVPGYFPDDVKSVTTPSDSEIRLTLTAPVSQTWFTLNELSQITPMPQHAWDKTSSTGPIGDYDAQVASARQVYKYLDGQARSLQTYASNPLWQIVDGPWKLSSFETSGLAEFVPNPTYSGPNKPHLAKFVEQPFTSSAAEFNALRAGQLTYGYVPQTDASQTPLLKASGYQVDPWTFWSMQIVPINYHNPTNGAIFSQLYIRQALQSAIDQPQYISSIFHGDAAPDYGPVPTKPSSPYLSKLTSGPVYPYNPAHASALLTSHGWKTGNDGVAACVSPGSGPNQCGAGIRQGQRLSFKLVYESGVPEVDQEMRAFKSALSTIGIDLALSQTSQNEVISLLTPCTPNQATCSWQMAYVSWQYAPNNYPSGEIAFTTGAVGNWGSYSDKTMDQKIAATTTLDSLAVFHDWVDYSARQLPVLFLPVPPYQISAIRSNLAGATPQPVDGLSLTPETWYFTK